MNKLMVIMVLFFSLSLGAQQAVFKGLLVDSTGRGYVQGAEIHFVRNDTSVWTTIPAGHFYMSLHKFLSDTVIITHQVWGTLRFTINLKDRSVKDTLIRLPLACRTHPVSDICPVCKSNKDVIPVIYGLP
ncbi:MAG TPA: hypothetical protein VNZ86_10955, partial [Bacteroidia bacterium]|nr:hypothetical protein [Bacteroidia bacterium]